ncbi:SWFGD domain-containing protein, partial [Nostoc sp. 3335mG]
MARAGDEVRSWFGDEEAERRRERDQRYDERMSRYDDRHSDHAYRSWRDTQVSAFDRDYDEYRQENATRFQNEFTAFRTERQTQRDSLTKVTEHMEVLGSDGEHVGTVDKVRGDRIILTKSDADAGGHHHSIPSRWVDSVDDKVKLRKSASEAKKAWRDEEEQQAMFGNQSSQRSSYGNDRFGNDRNSDSNRSTSQYGSGSSANSGQSSGSGTTGSSTT